MCNFYKLGLEKIIKEIEQELKFETNINQILYLKKELFVRKRDLQRIS